MLRYKKYQDNRKNAANKGYTYGRAVHELMEFDEFINHMAQHHCAFSEATIKGVLIEMQTCLRELLLEGKAVRMGDLGIFKIGLRTKPSAEAKDFNAHENIKGVRMNLFLGKRFRAADLMKDLRIREADKYSPDDVDDSGEQGTTDPGNDEP